MPTARQLFNIAHRGARSLAPENTMMAIEKAWEIGAHGIEVDIRATADNEFVLLHDSTPARTTDVHHIFPDKQDNPVHTFSLTELKRLDAGSWFIDADPFEAIGAGQLSADDVDKIKGVQIPTLAEALDFVKTRSWFINIELKDLPLFSLVDLVLDLLEELKLSPSWFSLASFNHDYLHRIRELRPNYEINALIGGNGMRPQNWATYDFEIYNANADLTDEKQIERALAHGCQVNLYTVNEPEQMRRFLHAGVSKIITDYPQKLALLKLESL
jgi:glycerophosphoryl diester phosphodiesterase